MGRKRWAIIYNHRDENGEVVYNSIEIVYGDWHELQETVSEMKKSGCFDIEVEDCSWER